MIVCAAVKITYLEPDACSSDEKELVICGHRHSNCFEIIRHLNLIPILRTQGFINHKGDFLDRKEAFEHAMDIGQSNATQRWYWEDHKQCELYSEDLY